MTFNNDVNPLQINLWLRMDWNLAINLDGLHLECNSGRPSAVLDQCRSVCQPPTEYLCRVRPLIAQYPLQLMNDACAVQVAVDTRRGP